MKLGWESIMLHSGQSKALAPKKKKKRNKQVK